jgi:hypothetical protein
MAKENSIFPRLSNVVMGQEFLKWLAIISMVADHVSEHLQIIK